MKPHYVIAIAGGSGSGKTTLAKKLAQHFADETGAPAILGQDSYYLDQSHRFDRDGGQVNFDHPDALEFSLLAEHLQSLKNGKDVQVPLYDFSSHRRLKETEQFGCHSVILVEGTLLFSQDLLLPLFDEMIFLEVEEALRFQRRLKRDVEERGRTAEGVRDQFFRQVKPMHDRFVEPSKLRASLIIQQTELIVTQRPASAFRNSLIRVLNGILPSF